MLVIGVLLLVCSTYDNLSTTATPELDLPVDVQKIDIIEPVGIEKDVMDNVNHLEDNKIIGGK